MSVKEFQQNYEKVLTDIHTSVILWVWLKFNKEINDSGMSFKAVAEKSGMLRETLYNRLKGLGEFKASEISSLQATLHLTTKERDEIFFKKNSELNSTKNQNK